MQGFTVFKSFRLSRVGRFIPEKTAHHMYQYLTEGEVYNRIKNLDSAKLLLLIVVQICLGKGKQCRNLKQQRHYKTYNVCSFFSLKNKFCIVVRFAMQDLTLRPFKKDNIYILLKYK